MKKTLAILAAAATLIATAACSAEKPGTDAPETTSPEISTQTVMQEVEVQTAMTAEEAVGIFMDNKSVWSFKEFDDYAGEYYYFLDLDFDGVCELVVSNHGGSGNYTFNKYYKINTENKTVEAVASNEGDEGGYDLIDKEEVKLLKNKTDGSFRYFLVDDMLEGAGTYENRFYTVSLEGSTVTGERVAVYAYNDFALDNVVEKYYFNQNGELTQVSKEEYDRMNEKFFAQYEDVNLKFTELDGEAFDKAQAEQQLQLMLDAYNGFSYEK